MGLFRWPCPKDVLDLFFDSDTFNDFLKLYKASADDPLLMSIAVIGMTSTTADAALNVGKNVVRNAVKKTVGKISKNEMLRLAEKAGFKKLKVAPFHSHGQTVFKEGCGL